MLFIIGYVVIIFIVLKLYFQSWCFDPYVSDLLQKITERCKSCQEDLGMKLASCNAFASTLHASRKYS